MKQQQQ